MLVVYPARSRDTCAAQSEGLRKLFLRLLHPRMMMGSQSSGELKRSVSVCKGDCGGMVPLGRKGAGLAVRQRGFGGEENVTKGCVARNNERKALPRVGV